MFKKGDVLQCKSGGSPIRLLNTIHHGRMGLHGVQYTGYVTSIVGDEHYSKISYWRWLHICFLHTIHRLVEMLDYRQSKNLGLACLMSPSDYWKDHLHYKEVLIPVMHYGYIAGSKKIQVLVRPTWREVNYSNVVDKPIGPWLYERIHHMLPSWLLK